MDEETWTVVHFTKENSVEAVPTKWIIGNNKCFWPSYTSEKLRSSIKNLEHPSSCWESYDIRMFRHATFGSYQEALNKSNVATYNSDVNKSESRETRKNRKKTESSTSSEEEEVIPAPPRKYKPKITSADATLLNTGTQCLCCPIHRNELQDVKNIAKDSVKKCNLLISLTTEVLDETKKIFNELKNLKIDKFLQPSCETESFLSSFCFPLATVEEFDKLEDYLNDEGHFTLAVKDLSKMGGNDIYEFTKRSISWLFKNILLKEFTWFGTKQKRALATTKCGEIIMRAAEKTSLFGDKKVVEDAIKKYMRRAKERHEYEIKKH